MRGLLFAVRKSGITGASMSRVERIQDSDEQRSKVQPQQSEGGRAGSPKGEQSHVGRTPPKAEGEVRDVEEALRRQR